MDAKKKTFDYERYGKLALFAELEDARRNKDFERAARVKRELERLGVIVRYPKRAEGNNDA